MSALPVAKLAALAIKQLAKPLATIAKERAKQSYFFRTYICMPPAQFYHRCEVKLKMWVMNLGKAVEVPKLNETMAIELGATLLGEFIIFTSGAVLVVAEVVRQNKKASAQKQRELEEMQALMDRLRDLEIETSRHDAQLREVNRLCAALHGGVQQQQLSQEQLRAIASQLQQVTASPEASSLVKEVPSMSPPAGSENKVTTINQQEQLPISTTAVDGGK